mgnify:FL=1
MPNLAVHAMIRGRVQGVWYRGWTIKEASRRGLTGWVRNRTSGCVEALFQGKKFEIDQMINACWIGPPNATVIDIEITHRKTSEYHDFQCRSTV